MNPLLRISGDYNGITESDIENVDIEELYYNFFKIQICSKTKFPSNLAKIETILLENVEKANTILFEHCVQRIKRYIC